MLKWAREHYVEDFGLKPGKLLDAACGEGFWADMFVDMGFEAHGFDAESIYIENGRKKYPRVELEEADVFGDLPYLPGSFDVVLARALPFFYSYHFTDMKKVINNLLPLVAYGGTLLLGFYSDGSGEKRPGLYTGSFWHHPHETFLRVAEECGIVTHSVSLGNYCQIGMRP